MNSLSGWLGRKTLSALKSLRLSSPLGATSLVDCPRWPLASCVRLFPTIAGHVYSQTSSRPTLTEYFVALGIFGILIGLSPCGGPNSNSLGKAPTRASLGSAQSNWFGVLALHRKACGGEISKDFDLAIEHLRDVERLLLRTTSDDVALLAFFLRSACERFGEATIYRPLRQLGRLNPARLSDVNMFARRQYARGRGILWQSQKQGIERLLNNSSFALCTPTGSGKTLVANLAILKELLILREEDGLAPLALYVVPSRALAGEVEAKLSPELGREFLVTGLYGGSDWGITDAWLTSDMPTVLIATVEKADALMRIRLYSKTMSVNGIVSLNIRTGL